jgi:hypothetical protein
MPHPLVGSAPTPTLDRTKAKLAERHGLSQHQQAANNANTS